MELDANLLIAEYETMLTRTNRQLAEARTVNTYLSKENEELKAKLSMLERETDTHISQLATLTPQLSEDALS